MEGRLLPLFPLQVVLFPRAPLPLHVFEDRYKDMFGEILRTHGEFGVVRAGEKGIVNTGCTATVEKVLKRYQDGRLDLLAIGRRRFEIYLLNDEKTYLRGAVEFFDDEPDELPAADEVRRRALEGYRELSALEDNLTPNEPELTDPQLSFQIAQSVPDLDFRQVLLATRSENERLKQFLDFLPPYLLKQKRISHIREVGPRNGHGGWQVP